MPDADAATEAEAFAAGQTRQPIRDLANIDERQHAEGDADRRQQAPARAGGEQPPQQGAVHQRRDQDATTAGRTDQRQRDDPSGATQPGLGLATSQDQRQRQGSPPVRGGMIGIDKPPRTRPS